MLTGPMVRAFGLCVKEPFVLEDQDRAVIKWKFTDKVTGCETQTLKSSSG